MRILVKARVDKTRARIRVMILFTLKKCIMIDHILVVFHTFTRYSPKKDKLFVTSTILTTPATFIFIAVFLAARKYFFFSLLPLNSISFALLTFLTAVLTNQWLSRIYIRHGSEIVRLASKLSKPMVFFNIFVTILLFLGSIFIFVLSLRFIR